MAEGGPATGTEAAMVGRDHIGEVLVSTVFLGINHNFLGEGRPILFETMVFGGEHDQEQERYCTEQEALAGHERWCAVVRVEAS